MIDASDHVGQRSFKDPPRTRFLSRHGCRGFNVGGLPDVRPGFDWVPAVICVCMLAMAVAVGALVVQVSWWLFLGR